MNKFKKIFKEYVIYVLVLIIILLAKTYIISPIVVSGDSMDSTLKSGDVMLLNKLEYRTSEIKRFDIVVVKYEGRYIIKRVIGLPGDEVKVEDNTLYINGKAYVEKYLDKDTTTDDFIIDEVPKNHYFVLGDNREVSLDSRIIGPVSKEDIVGKAIYTIFPFNRWGTKE